MNFELWLFVIKRLGTTMDVAKAIYDRMSPDMQQELRDEFEMEYGNGSKNNRAQDVVHKVRITVLKRECNNSLQKEYLRDKAAGPCPFFERGQVFVVDEDSYSRCMDGKFCTEAWESISRYVYAGLRGGSFKKGLKDDKVMVACCSNCTRPVIFKLERIDS